MELAKKLYTKLYTKLIEILTCKRMVSLYWHTGGMLFAGFSDLVIQNLTAWNPDSVLTVGLGLLIAQFTKYLNTKA